MVKAAIREVGIDRDAGAPRSENPTRFFIITAGRTGSTLLSSALAHAGADFGLEPVASWDESRGGAFEHDAVVAAARYFRQAYDLSRTKPIGVRRWPWVYLQHRAKQHLRQALTAACYLKAVNLDLAVQSAAKLGYIPKIIVSYRPFTAHALSLSQMFARHPVDVIEADYLRTYRHALIQLHLHGGCVIGYEELCDPGNTTWLAPLAGLTGLAPDDIAAGLRACYRPAVPGGGAMPSLSSEAERLCASLDALVGQLIPPSYQAQRNLARRSIHDAPSCASESHASPAWLAARDDV